MRVYNGNSWNGATFVLTDNNGATVATGTLANGSLDTLFFCIPDGCYYMDVSNSSNPNDSSHWSVVYNGVQVAFGNVPATNVLVPINSICAGVTPGTAPCQLTGSASPITITCGDSSVLSANGNITSVFDQDFNSCTNRLYLPTLQLETIGVPSLDGSNFLWIGAAASFPRTMTTVPLDLSCGGDICFEMRYAIQEALLHEGPDLVSEGVYLQYSTTVRGPWILLLATNKWWSCHISFYTMAAILSIDSTWSSNICYSSPLESS